MGKRGRQTEEETAEFVGRMKWKKRSRTARRSMEKEDGIKEVKKRRGKKGGRDRGGGG